MTEADDLKAALRRLIDAEARIEEGYGEDAVDLLCGDQFQFGALMLRAGRRHRERVEALRAELQTCEAKYG